MPPTGCLYTSSVSLEETVVTRCGITISVVSCETLRIAADFLVPAVITTSPHAGAQWEKRHERKTPFACVFKTGSLPFLLNKMLVGRQDHFI